MMKRMILTRKILFIMSNVNLMTYKQLWHEARERYLKAESALEAIREELSPTPKLPITAKIKDIVDKALEEII